MDCNRVVKWTTCAALVGLALAPVLVAGQETTEPSPEELRYLAIETEVSLGADPATARYALAVNAQKGVIELTGEVPDDRGRKRAERVARRVARGYDVEIVNKIRLYSELAQPAPTGDPTPLDQKQMQKLESLLEDRFPELVENIYVSFDVQPMPTILLEGLIPSYQQKLEISRFVRQSFRGLPVLNNLRVRRERQEEKVVYVVNPKEPRQVVGENLSRSSAGKQGLPGDDEIGTQLGDTLRVDPVLKSSTIEVRVLDGVVWLAGKVATLGQQIRAVRLASVQPGVRYVVNQLVISPGGEPTERSQAAQRLDPEDVRVSVRRYLSSRVPDLEGATADVVEGTIVVTPPPGVALTDNDVHALESRLSKLPELKGYAVTVAPMSRDGATEEAPE